MKRHYNFSKGVRGKFFQNEDSVNVTISFKKDEHPPVIEIFRDENGFYKYRLKKDENIIFESAKYQTRKKCIDSLDYVRTNLIPAETIYIY